MTTLLPRFSSARIWAMVALGIGGAAVACSSTSEAPLRAEVNTGAGAMGNNAGVTNTTSVIVPTTSSGNGSGGTAPRDPRCDDMGNCSCINIGMLGRLPTYGAVPGQDGISALEQWLNANSSAAASTHVTKPTLTAEFLANYDVLVLQAMETLEGAGNQWQFSAEEIAAFEAWVRQGGGVIALMGYGANPAEATPSNALLAFTGLQYSGLTGPGDTSLEGSCPNECCYCLGNSIPSAGWNAAHPISANMTAVGSYYGRSVSAPAGAETVASSGATILGATVQVDAGRVFMFHDEWVTYTSQWDGTGLTNDCRTEDPNHSCYNVHPSTTYQVPQFWYNALRWASSEVECFDIDVDDIIK